MKNNYKCLVAFLFLMTGIGYAQVGIGTTSPDNSAALEVYSTSKGLLLPRLTTIQRDAISMPASGLMVFNTTTNELQVNTGTSTIPIWTVSGVGATGATGSNGLSAYQVAVSNGFLGTEAQWLASLIGAQGATGNNGSDGQSAYQVAVSNGFSGTQTQWLASLVGATGPQGPAGSNASVTGTSPINVSSGVVSLNDAGVTTAKLADNAVTIAKLPSGSTSTTFLRGDGTWASPSGNTYTASNGLSLSSGSDVQLGGTLSASTIVAQSNNNLTFKTGTGRTIVDGNFQTTGLLYAKAPRVHPVASSITWQEDDVVILLQSGHTGNVVFPSASSNPNRLIGINNRSGSARIITNTSGGDTGIYTNEQLTQIASASGVSWFISDGTSWRLYSGRP